MSATVPMSVDRRPDLPGERARIESCADRRRAAVRRGESAAAATTVVHRLRKSDTNLLGVSRAFGDYVYKSYAELPPSGQAVCTPEIFVRKRADYDDMYLILARDGIWDVMSRRRGRIRGEARRGTARFERRQRRIPAGRGAPAGWGRTIDRIPERGIEGFLCPAINKQRTERCI